MCNIYYDEFFSTEHILWVFSTKMCSDALRRCLHRPFTKFRYSQSVLVLLGEKHLLAHFMPKKISINVNVK